MATYEGSISLIRLSDGAPGQPGTPATTFYTWIKYADDNIGTNMSDDSENKAYIGIAYNKIDQEESTNYEDYQWSKIQGIDGKNGEPGKDGENAPEVIVQYSSDNADWHNTLQETDIYIRFSYDGGKTYSNSSKFVGTDGQNGDKGEDAILYHLETDYEEILKTVDKFEEEYKTSIIPSTLRVILKKQKGEEVFTIGDLDDEQKYNFDLDFISMNQKVENIFTTGINDLYLEIGEERKQFFNKYPTYIELNFNVLLEQPLSNEDGENENEIFDSYDIISYFKTEEGYFILKVFNSENGNLIGQLPLHFRYAQSDETAKFSLHKSYIDMLVGNTAVVITEQGLTIKNGNFEITRTEGDIEENFVSFRHDIFYSETTDTVPLTGKKYYIKNESNEYTEISSLEKFEENIIYYEKHNGQLSISGNATFSGELKSASGVFSGRLEAESGYFKGELNGNSGTIGGFRIEDGKLTSTHTFAVEGENDEEIQVPFVELNGNDGKIIAKNIEIGSGAIITDYIRLGSTESYIYNPDLNEGKFISTTGYDNEHDTTGSIVINNNATASIGNIFLDGRQSKIYGENFAIFPDKATFSNIDISGTIHASVFETGKTQAVGGAMYFKPATEVEQTIFETVVEDSEETTKIEILLKDKTFTLEQDDYVYCIFEDKTKFLSQINVDEEENQIRYFLSNYPTAKISTEEQIQMIIYLGNKQQNDTLIIGVNSGSNKEGFLHSQGISFIDFSNGTEDTEKNFLESSLQTKLFMGNLNSLNKDNVTGYGFYGENVYLTGSLTTQNSNTYAGVNTLSQIESTKFGTVDSTTRENIIFWGGSNGVSTTEIQNAPFQVTDKGSLYASKGVFEGTIITNAQIEASSLRAAAIYGSGTGKGEDGYYPALRILSTTSFLETEELDKVSNGGIEFWKVEKSETQDKDIKTLRIDEKGIYNWDNYSSNWKHFVKIENNNVFFSGTLEDFGNQVTIGRLSLGTTFDENGIVEKNYISSFMVTEGKETSLATINFPRNSTQNLSIMSNNTEVATFNQEKINLLTNRVEINKELLLAQGKVRYAPVEEENNYGYDLFIS